MLDPGWGNRWALRSSVNLRVMGWFAQKLERLRAVIGRRDFAAFRIQQALLDLKIDLAVIQLAAPAPSGGGGPDRPRRTSSDAGDA